MLVIRCKGPRKCGDAAVTPDSGLRVRPDGAPAICPTCASAAEYKEVKASTPLPIAVLPESARAPLIQESRLAVDLPKNPVEGTVVRNEGDQATISVPTQRPRAAVPFKPAAAVKDDRKRYYFRLYLLAFTSQKARTFSGAYLDGGDLIEIVAVSIGISDASLPDKISRLPGDLFVAIDKIFAEL